MAVSEVKAQEQQRSDLIYGLYDRPPLRETVFAALQHLLAIFVAIITPPLIISSALKFDLTTTDFLSRCRSSFPVWLLSCSAGA